MKVKEEMYMKKILEAIKNFFSASHERERKGIQATKHGMFNNFVYAVKLTWQLNNQFIIAMIVMGVLSALYMLIGIYIPKIVLALVENKVTTDTMIKVLVAVGIIILVVKLINTKAQYVGEYAWDKVYKGLVSKYLRKSFTTDFKNMENPDFLDLIERSKHAMYNYQGISGYCRRGSNILSNIVLVVIAGAAIAVINPLIILVLVVISYFIYKILDSTMEWTKVNFRDAMSSNFRKNYYFSSTARDFKYAKDILNSTVSLWIRPRRKRSSVTIAIPALVASFTLRIESFLPFSQISPQSGCSIPKIHSIISDRPAPISPPKPSISPLCAVKLIS